MYCTCRQFPSHSILIHSIVLSRKIHVSPGGFNAKSLYITHLEEIHSGEYKCEAREMTKGAAGEILYSSVTIVVLSKLLTLSFCPDILGSFAILSFKWWSYWTHASFFNLLGNCSTKMFECPSKPASPSHCIFKRYVCDGKPDCANGEDESAHLANCGKFTESSNLMLEFYLFKSLNKPPMWNISDPTFPCRDKLMCDDGRCIPHSWCCPVSKPDCNATYPYKECCKRKYFQKVIIFLFCFMISFLWYFFL